MIQEPSKSLIYLAAPYSDPDPAVSQRRFELINVAASYMMRQGLRVFSPISHSHPIAMAGGLPTGWEYWEAYDSAILSTCWAFVVLMLPGWHLSVGVGGETNIARNLQLQCFWAGVDGLDEFLLEEGARGGVQCNLPGLDSVISEIKGRKSS